MWKAMSALTLATAVLAVQPAAAQQPSAKDIKKLQADIDKLRVQLDEIAARLDKLAPSTAKPQGKDSTGGWGGGFGGPPWARGGMGGWGGMGGYGGWGGKADPEQMKKWMEEFGKGEFGKGGFGKGGFGKDGDRKSAESSKSDLERRLDRVLDQLEELRRELKKK